MAAEAAVMEPTQGAYGTNSDYLGTGFADNWKNWLTASGITYHAAGPAFATWDLDLGAGSVSSALFQLDANGTSYNYGIPAGVTLNFALVTEPWSPSTPDTSNSGPSYGTNLGVDFVQVTAVGGDQNADITTLLQTWQASPSSYFGVRFHITGNVNPVRGGVTAPNDSTYSGTTGNLIIEQSIPEPTSLAALAVGSLLALRRRRA